MTITAWLSAILLLGTCIMLIRLYNKTLLYPSVLIELVLKTGIVATVGWGVSYHLNIFL